MDDAEYYEKMRNRNLNRNYIASKKTRSVKNINSSKSDFKNWATTQGREDAEMLYERKYDQDQDGNY